MRVPALLARPDYKLRPALASSEAAVGWRNPQSAGGPESRAPSRRARPCLTSGFLPSSASERQSAVEQRADLPTPNGACRDLRQARRRSSLEPASGLKPSKDQRVSATLSTASSNHSAAVPDLLLSSLPRAPQRHRRRTSSQLTSTVEQRRHHPQALSSAQGQFRAASTDSSATSVQLRIPSSALQRPPTSVTSCLDSRPALGRRLPCSQLIERWHQSFAAAGERFPKPSDHHWFGTAGTSASHFVLCPATQHLAATGGRMQQGGAPSSASPSEANRVGDHRTARLG